MPKSSAVFRSNHPVVTYFSKTSETFSQSLADEVVSSVQRDIVPEKSSTSGHDGYVPSLESAVAGREPDFLKTVKTEKPAESLSAKIQKSSEALSSEKVTVPMLTSGPLKPEEYPDYFNAIGGRIKEVAQSLAAKVHGASGEVRVSFILEYNGRVREAKIIPSASVGNSRLHRLALDSVRAASPFPPFPDAHAREDIPFDVVIDFRLD